MNNKLNLITCLLASYIFISNNYTLDKEQKKNLKFNTLVGQDIVDAVARLCIMNMYLHWNLKYKNYFLWLNIDSSSASQAYFH